MDWSAPASAVVPSLDAVVLGVLAGVTEPISGREVHRRARRGSNSGVQLILTRMTAHGLLDVIDAPPTRLYSLNRDHVAAPAALLLLDLRGQLFDRIRDTFAGWNPAPVAAAVFGSAARGEGGVDSDLDLIVVRPETVPDDHPSWSNQVYALERLVRRWSGNPATIILVTPTQLVDMVDRAEPVVESLQEDAMALTTVSVLDLLREARP